MQIFGGGFAGTLMRDAANHKVVFGAGELNGY